MKEGREGGNRDGVEREAAPTAIERTGRGPILKENDK